jgi:hypothetical protein
MQKSLKVNISYLFKLALAVALAGIFQPTLAFSLPSNSECATKIFGDFKVRPVAQSPKVEAAIAHLPEELKSLIIKNEGPHEELGRMLARALDPYTTEGALNEWLNDEKISPIVAKKLAEFVLLTHKARGAHQASKNVASAVNAWIRSPDEALFVYQNIDAFGASADLVFAKLLKENPFFANSHPVRGLPRVLQTFSFEKETPFNNPLVSYFWRVRSVPEEKWFELSDEERRLALIASLHYFNGKGKDIVPTTLSIDRFGQLKAEAAGAFEFVHPSYEFDIERVKQIAFAVEKNFKETHSFHFHQVFEISENPDIQRKFLTWHKLKTDRAIFLGLEAGLHTGSKTGVPELTNLNYINQETKFFTIGLRSGIYGDSYNTGYQKVGLEYRDALRDLPELFKRIIEPNIRDVEAEIWMKPSSPSPDDLKKMNVFKIEAARYGGLSPSQWELLNGYQNKHGKMEENLIHSITGYPIFSTPLEAIEDHMFFDYGTGEYYSPTTLQKERLKSARLKFEKDLNLLDQEIREHHENPSNYYGTSDIVPALRMIMAEWAKAAMVSEIYR